MNNSEIEYKKKLLETFKAFDAFCRKHDINYYAAYGTLIGAVRHKGLIPWDDDIDVLMLPDDYNKFCSYRGNVDGHYDIVDSRDENYWLLTLAKFVDMNTTLWEMEEYPCVTGVYIDVFPLYENNYDQAVKLKAQYEKFAVLLKRSMMHYSFNKVWSILYRGRILTFWKMLKDITHNCIMHSYYRKMYDHYLNKVQSARGDYYVCYEGDYKEGEIYPKEWFNKTMKIPFEDMMIDIPVDYDKMLTKIYGDYMQLPPEEKRVSHHPHYFLDLNRRWSIDEVKNLKKHMK